MGVGRAYAWLLKWSLICVYCWALCNGVCLVHGINRPSFISKLKVWHLANKSPNVRQHVKDFKRQFHSTAAGFWSWQINSAFSHSIPLGTRAALIPGVHVLYIVKHHLTETYCMHYNNTFHLHSSDSSFLSVSGVINFVLWAHKKDHIIWMILYKS